MPDPRPAVIVIGPFRSGTSLVCRLLRELGVSFGPDAALVATDRYNPVGYWERLDVNHANGRLLESAGRSFAQPGDPASLADEGDLSTLDDADLSWTSAEQRWGLKDPRFCATASAWFDSGRLERSSTSIVHVSRDLDAAVRSSLRCPWVNHFFDHDPERVRAGVETYRRLAAIQVERIDVPTRAVAYEALCADPAGVVTSLADLVGVGDRSAIDRAAALVGRRRARARFFADRVRGRFGLSDRAA